MKKFLSLALALTMALTLAACGGKTDTPPADTNDGSTAGQTGGKLVVYSALNRGLIPSPSQTSSRRIPALRSSTSLWAAAMPWPVCRQRWPIQRQTFW